MRLSIHNPIGPVMIDLGGFSITVEEKEKLSHPKVGGVILFSRNFESKEQVRELIFEVRAARQGKLLVAVDQEGGRVQRFRQGFTSLPPASSYGAIFQKNPSQALETTRLAGWLMASELLTVGVDFSFAPVLDVDSGISEIIGDRSFSQDPEIVSALAIAFKQGSGQAGMASVGKHFPGHGSVAPDSHLALPEDPRALEGLLERDLCPFQSLISGGIEGIMPAHVVYSRIDDSPAGFSEVWLKQILRNKLGFEGAIFSDDLSMKGAECAGNFPRRAQAALQAGCDMVLVCNNPEGAESVLENLPPMVVQPDQQKRLSLMNARKSTSFAALSENPTWEIAKQKLEQFET